ncbi:LuxR C-terminal-related transcriptional regulator [Streptomyces sp. PmtG]
MAGARAVQVPTAARAREAGAGRDLKDTPPRDLIAAVATVAAGGAMLAPTVTRRLIHRYATRGPSRRAQARERLTSLTGREREVLRAVADCLSNAEVGRDLFMSGATAKAHVSRVLAKLGAANRVQAAIVAHEAGPLAHEEGGGAAPRPRPSP